MGTMVSAQATATVLIFLLTNVDASFQINHAHYSSEIFCYRPYYKHKLLFTRVFEKKRINDVEEELASDEELFTRVFQKKITNDEKEEGGSKQTSVTTSNEKKLTSNEED